MQIGPALPSMPPPHHTHCKHNLGQMATPFISWFPIHSSASVRGLSESELASHL